MHHWRFREIGRRQPNNGEVNGPSRQIERRKASEWKIDLAAAASDDDDDDDEDEAKAVRPSTLGL